MRNGATQWGFYKYKSIRMKRTKEEVNKKCIYKLHFIGILFYILGGTAFKQLVKRLSFEG